MIAAIPNMFMGSMFTGSRRITLLTIAMMAIMITTSTWITFSLSMPKPLPAVDTYQDKEEVSEDAKECSLFSSRGNL